MLGYSSCGALIATMLEVKKLTNYYQVCHGVLKETEIINQCYVHNLDCYCENLLSTTVAFSFHMEYEKQVLYQGCESKNGVVRMSVM